jgi:hypothetical protein
MKKSSDGESDEEESGEYEDEEEVEEEGSVEMEEPMDPLTSRQVNFEEDPADAGILGGNPLFGLERVVED